MKKIFLLVISLLLVFTSCDNKKIKPEENDIIVATYILGIYSLPLGANGVYTPKTEYLKEFQKKFSGKLQAANKISDYEKAQEESTKILLEISRYVEAKYPDVVGKIRKLNKEALEKCNQDDKAQLEACAKHNLMNSGIIEILKKHQKEIQDQMGIETKTPKKGLSFNKYLKKK